MGNSEDKLFMKNFSLVILVLMGIAVICIIIARNIIPETLEDSNPSRSTLKEERLQPMGAVRTEMPAVTTVAAQAPAATVDPASINGADVYTQACQACHMSGAAGAPIPGSDLWAERAGKGLDALASSAINGLNAMPAKGGRMDLSDAEVTAAVEHMLAQ